MLTSEGMRENLRVRASATPSGPICSQRSSESSSCCLNQGIISQRDKEMGTYAWSCHVCSRAVVANTNLPLLGKKPRTKAPKIQRLVTPRVLQHKRRRIALKKQRTQKNKEEAAEYAKLLAKRMKVNVLLLCIFY